MGYSWMRSCLMWHNPSFFIWEWNKKKNFSGLELVWYICIALQKFFLLKFKFLEWSILDFSFNTHLKGRLLLNSWHYKRMRLLVNKIDYCITKPIGRNVNEQWNCKNPYQAINFLLFGHKQKKFISFRKRKIFNKFGILMDVELISSCYCKTDLCRNMIAFWQTSLTNDWWNCSDIN